MKLQDYKCHNCDQFFVGTHVLSEALPELVCPFCGMQGSIKKKFSIAVHRPMAEHFNMATGTWESSMAGIREKFRKASDEATERTGIPHNFQPVDLRDKEALGVTDEGLDDTARRKRQTGQTEGQTYHQFSAPDKTTLPYRT